EKAEELAPYAAGAAKVEHFGDLRFIESIEERARSTSQLQRQLFQMERVQNVEVDGAPVGQFRNTCLRRNGNGRQEDERAEFRPWSKRLRRVAVGNRVSG